MTSATESATTTEDVRAAMDEACRAVHALFNTMRHHPDHQKSKSDVPLFESAYQMMIASHSLLHGASSAWHDVEMGLLESESDIRLPANVWHTSYFIEQARYEARRLSALFPEKVFIVRGTEGSYRVYEITSREAEESYCPF